MREGLPKVDATEGLDIEVNSCTVKSVITVVKAAGLSGVVAEILKISVEVGHMLVIHIVNRVVQEGVISNDWCSCIIINCYKGKGDALERGNYRDIKLTDLVMKVTEKVIVQLMRKRISPDEMQFRLMPG